MKKILLSLLALLPLALSAADRKPNFLFVYTDDQRWDAMSVVQREQGERARFPWFQTPSMDRLAGEGVRFRNAFVTLSLCAPSRAAFLSGRYNHLNGVAGNRVPFPTNSVTHASLMTAAGYATAYIGKWHMGGQTGQRPGFSYSASFIGQGRYWNCPFEINGQTTPTTGWVDDVSTDYAIQFIKAHKDQPFSVVVGFKACHGPNEPPDRAKDRFADATARPVPNLGVPAIYRASTKIPPGEAKAFAPDHQPQLLPHHLRRRRQPRPPPQSPRRPRPRPGHRRRLRQRQRLLQRRARPGRQTLRVRRIPPHPPARPLPEALPQGQDPRPDGAEH